MDQIYTRRIKAITGNGTGSVRITPTPGKRLHGVGINLTWASGVSTSGDTLIEQLAAITEIRVLVGSNVKRRISATDLRDYMLLNGATYDFDAVSTYVAQMYIPFAEDWFIASVADALAWNPVLLGGPISIELDVTALNTSYLPTVVAYERVSNDLDAPSAGIITWETLSVVAGGTSFFVESNVFKARGRLIQATIYPSSGAATTAITPVSLFVGKDDVLAHEGLAAGENDDLLGRAGLTPRNTSRITYAYNYDLVFVRGDALSHGIDLDSYGTCKLKVEAGGAMSGTCKIVVARLEPK
jgi:hypothetical protein